MQRAYIFGKIVFFRSKLKGEPVVESWEIMVKGWAGPDH